MFINTDTARDSRKFTASRGPGAVMGGSRGNNALEHICLARIALSALAFGCRCCTIAGARYRTPTEFTRRRSRTGRAMPIAAVGFGGFRVCKLEASHQDRFEALGVKATLGELRPQFGHLELADVRQRSRGGSGGVGRLSCRLVVATTVVVIVVLGR